MTNFLLVSVRETELVSLNGKNNKYVRHKMDRYWLICMLEIMNTFATK